MSTGGPPGAEIDPMRDDALRLRAVEERVERILQRLGITAIDRAGTEEPAATLLGAPQRGLDRPAAWRSLTDGQLRVCWLDLAAWVEWLIDAYRLPPHPWATWWLCPGACEELAALRAWHREVADIAIAAMPGPGVGADLADLVEWSRRERNARCDWAHGAVEWHDAMWRTVGQLAGSPEYKPLLVRETEATNLTVELREREAAARVEGFQAWLDQRLPPTTGSSSAVASRDVV